MTTKTAVGVDGCPDGWLAVQYIGEQFERAEVYEDIQELWEASRSAESILIDVPIGLRENDNTPRPCDREARTVLGSPRGSSVFPTPIRGALDASSYAEARQIQEEKTGGSLGAQTWGISPKIAELDEFIREDKEGRVGKVREAHPEVCFWAFNDETATEYSKTGQPVAAFWERVEILEAVDEEIMPSVKSAGRNLDAKASNDDLLDAFVLALTASSVTGSFKTLPREEREVEEDPRDLPMEMVFSKFDG